MRNLLIGVLVHRPVPRPEPRATRCNTHLLRSRDIHMDDPWHSEAQTLLDRLEQEDHPREFFHALRDLIDQRYPRGRGRRKGQDNVDDSARLAYLEELLRSGTDEEAAIKQVAVDDPGDDEKNTIKRLRRKLPRVRAALQNPSRAEKDEILRKAFEERVEPWDL